MVYKLLAISLASYYKYIYVCRRVQEHLGSLVARICYRMFYNKSQSGLDTSNIIWCLELSDSVQVWKLDYKIKDQIIK